MAENSSFKELNKDTRDSVMAMGAEAKWMKGFHGLHQGAMADGAIDKKTKELMALAVGIVTHCDRCIASHLASALAAGASRDEVGETIGVAVMMGGGPALMYGITASKALDELA